MALKQGEFYGTRVRAVRGREFGFYEYKYEAGSSVPRHAHEHAFVSLLVGGTYDERVGVRNRRSPKGVVFHPAGEEHSERFGNRGARLFGFDVSPSVLHRLREYNVNVQSASEHFGVESKQSLLRVLSWLGRESKLATFAAEGVAYEVLAGLAHGQLTRRESARPGWLRDAREMLDQDTAFDLRLSDIGDALGIHPCYIARQFRKHVGCSVGEYVRRRRLEFALDRITRSEHGLARIAADAGFSDQSHLQRAVKSAVGATPMQLRSRAESQGRSTKSEAFKNRGPK